MTRIEFVKAAVTTIVGIGTSRISAAIIANNVPQDKLIDKVTIPAASAVIGMMAAEKTKVYTDALIDEAVAWYDKNVTK